MIQELYPKRVISLFRFAFATAFLLFTSLVCIYAQTTISTTGSFTNDTTVNTVTFNFQNTNSYPVVIRSIDGILSDYRYSKVELWYKTSAINGNPGIISTGNGWAMLNADTVSGIENSADSITRFFTGLNLIIPANTTYGIAISAIDANPGLSNGTFNGTLKAAYGLPVFSIGGGGCNIISGTNSGYAAISVVSAPPAAPTFSPVAWLGKITFAQYLPCTGTPAAATISGPTAICANAMFTLTSSPYAAGMTIAYQWQKYNTTTLAWEDIASAINPNYTNTIGINASTQFRLKTSCTISSTPVYSNVLSVNIGSGLPGGIYTINNYAQSSATNFVSFSAAAAAMKCGITGPVTINVDPTSGPYAERPVFNNIPGTSAINRIRINGNGRTLQYYNRRTAEVGILNMAGTKFMTIDSLTIRSLGFNLGIGVLIADSAKFDTISHCFIDMRSISVSNLGGGVFPDSFSLTATTGISLSDYSHTGSCYAGYNYILGSNGTGGPYYGIFDGHYSNYYSQDASDSGTVIEHNIIENVSNVGILSNGDNRTLIAHNDIHRTNKTVNTSLIGIRVWTLNTFLNTAPIGTVDRVKVIGNRIHNPSASSIAYIGFEGIEVQDGNWIFTTTPNNIGTNILIANNAIYNVNASLNPNYTMGIFFYGGNNPYALNDDLDTTMIYHNTIDISQATNSVDTGSIFGIYYIDNENLYGVNYNENVFIKNNLVTITNNPTASTIYGFNYYSYINPINKVYARRNNFYLSGNAVVNQYYGRHNNVNYNTITAFQVAYPTMENGSLSVNPQYTSSSTGDFTPLNNALYGNGENLLASVSKDILGRNRSSSPTPGAFEIVTDAGVNALLSPLGAYCSGTKTVQVNVHNFGIVNISNVQVNWSLNGVLQAPVSYTGAIVSNGNAAVNLGNTLFLLNTPVTIKAWTSAPNNQNDGTNTNDTLTVTTQSTINLPVNIGSDDAICAGDALTLDAGNPGSVYLWDNLATTQTRTIQDAGTYYVKVTTSDGCMGTDTMTLSLLPLPVVDLGPDVEICEGDTLTFDAGNPGADYKWDNGAITQARVVGTADNYDVQVTDDFGCTGVDTVIVTMKNMPMADAINATHADSGLYTFYPLNPAYVTNYIWNFGDNTPEAAGFMVQHQYQYNGIYTVTLKMEGECPGMIVTQDRTVDVFSAPSPGTGVHDILITGDILLYPNPAKDIMQIENRSDAKMLNVAVYNILGQLIFNQKTDNEKEYQLNTSALANGLYSIKIGTDKGMFMQKFEVMN